MPAGSTPVLTASFWKLAVGFAVAFFVIYFIVELIWSRFDGTTFNARATAVASALSGVVFAFVWQSRRSERAG